MRNPLMVCRCWLQSVQDEMGSMGSKVSVVKLPKSGGVSQRQQQARQAARNERIFEYFNGFDRTLHPVTVTMEPEKLRVFRLGELAVAWLRARNDLLALHG